MSSGYTAHEFYNAPPRRAASMAASLGVDAPMDEAATIVRHVKRPLHQVRRRYKVLLVTDADFQLGPAF